VAEEEAEPGLGEGPAKAISVSLPEGTVRALRDYAGNRGVSALVAVAIEEHLRNQATRAYLAEFEEEHGPFTSTERQAAADVWSAAERRESRWHEAV
jgi:post-segregation antitoxin (ccd killing protein)